jgi:hypothetical protein
MQDENKTTENNLPSDKPILTSDKTNLQDKNNLQEDNLEEDENKILTFDEEYPEEELDDETRALIFSKSMEIDIDEDIYGFSKVKTDKKKEKTKKQKDNMTIKQFIDKLDENKPKKWISKRAETKRPLIEKKEKIVERKFNPRLPPFKTLKKEVKPDKIAEYTESNFPTLK